MRQTIFFLLLIFFFLNFSLLAVDFVSKVMEDPNYKQINCTDVVVAFSFDGSPNTLKNHSIEGVAQDIVCSSVNISYEPLVINNHYFLLVIINNAKLPLSYEWSNIGKNDYNESNPGQLKIDVYAKLTGKTGYQKIGTFEGEEVIVFKYNEYDGTIQFLCKRGNGRTIDIKETSTEDTLQTFKLKNKYF
jgi:hypothetical protein